MSSYILKVLSANESISYSAKLSIWSMSHLITLGAICLLSSILGGGWIMLLIAAAFFLTVYLRYISTELVITNKRVIAKFGFISRKTVEINIGKIESVQVDQPLFGRIFNYGSLIVAGAGTPQAPIPGIKDPMSFRSAFVETQEKALAFKPAA